MSASVSVVVGVDICVCLPSCMQGLSCLQIYICLFFLKMLHTISTIIFKSFCIFIFLLGKFNFFVSLRHFLFQFIHVTLNPWQYINLLNFHASHSFSAEKTTSEDGCPGRMTRNGAEIPQLRLSHLCVWNRYVYIHTTQFPGYHISWTKKIKVQ